jgi:hypothetical protein
MEPEAGFIEVPVFPVGLPSQGRLFYSFHPAESPDDAPVLVFLNGGPGAATSAILMPYGTGPFTIDPIAADDPPYENPHSYTPFANLLYIDSRATGFSYEVDLAPGDPSARTCRVGTGWFPTADAAELIFVLLDFLDRHERLRNNPVVLVGESYGGTRAALIHYLIQRHADPEHAPLTYLGDVDATAPGLRERIAAHFELAFSPAPTTPEEIALQFGWQILIQPGLGSSAQFELADQMRQHDPDFAFLHSDTYFYDVRQSFVDAIAVADRTQRSLRDPAALELLLGVGLDRIAGLASHERGAAYRAFTWTGMPAFRGTDDPLLVRDLEQHLRTSLGDIDVDDAYFLPFSMPCDWVDVGEMPFNAFLDVLPRTRTFITDARWDQIVYTEVFPQFLGLELDRSLPEGAARPGVMQGDGIQIRFPTYEAGHAVTMGAPGELREDIAAWLEAEGALAE